MPRADDEKDFHHYTRAEMRAWLDRTWGSGRWQGLRRVRLIHGTGEVLGAEARRWCEEKGIEWTTEANNPGVTTLHPGRRAQTPAPPPNRPLARPLAKERVASRKAQGAREDDGRRISRNRAKARREKEGSGYGIREPGAGAETCDMRLATCDSESARLFAEEMERLDRADPAVLRRRKRE